MPVAAGVATRRPLVVAAVVVCLLFPAGPPELMRPVGLAAGTGGAQS